MKRGIIRVLWGRYDNSHRFLRSRIKVDNWIEFISRCEFNSEFVTYVMGLNNFDFLKSKGFNCVLVSDDISLFDPIKYKYRNKLEAIKYAFEVDGYDEIVYLDWDCFPVKIVDEQFWKKLGEKEKIQLNLQVYKHKKCFWRENRENANQRTIPNGGFVYIRDKQSIYDVIKLWEDYGKSDNDEMAWGMYVDSLSGSWHGAEYYFDNFEPVVSKLWRNMPYTKEQIESKDLYFLHKHGGKRF